MTTTDQPQTETAVTIDILRAWLREMRQFLDDEERGLVLPEGFVLPEGYRQQLALGEQIFDGEVNDRATADTLRGLLATGVWAAPLPAEVIPARIDNLFLATIAAVILRPLILPRRLPVDWHGQLARMTSRPLADLVSSWRTIVGERLPRQFTDADLAALIQALGQALGRPEAKVGIARLLGDFLDATRGGAYIAAHQLYHRQRPADERSSFTIPRLLAYIGGAAITGTIGNEAHALVRSKVGSSAATPTAGAQSGTLGTGDPAARPTASLLLVGSQMGQYASIGAALAAAPPDATVLIRPGTYNESLTIDHPVTLIADGPPGSVVIVATHAPCLTMASEQAAAHGLALRVRAHESVSYIAAVDIGRGKLTLERCAVTSDSYCGIAVHGPETTPIIRRCTVHE